ncbi:retrovirus-related pol polyprotein from transposon TNT 1-94 [Tanacetum coccineum]|uniref:Retrovirus-related pol polyprotein from transposon TNT 1-94 n=1 Tax=Tanacetum coccineum TaxID=301880 RepID=A0ABQ5HW80_9ASTR
MDEWAKMDGSLNQSHPDHQISEHNSKWTNDHPLENIIGEFARPVSTRLQLHEQALFCYYNAFLAAVEPKTYKDALTQLCWIKAMQEELNEFERLEVWELVPRPDKVMVITLKWIYKVKLVGPCIKSVTIYFPTISSLPGVLTPVRAINGFDMPLPVAVCSGLVNPLAPRKGKFHGGLITMSTLCT